MVDEDDDELEEIEAVLGALDGLLSRHFRILRQMVDRRLNAKCAGEAGNAKARASAQDLADEMGIPEEQAAADMARLAGSGLLRVGNSMTGGTPYAATALGEAAIDAAMTLREE